LKLSRELPSWPERSTIYLKFQRWCAQHRQSCEEIDAAITISQGTENAEFAARLKDLTEAIAQSTEANEEQKRQLLEVTTAISDQVIAKSPSQTVIGVLFEKLVSLTSGLSTIAGAAEKLYQAWQALGG
jgi:hypothetical protein